MPQSVAQMLDGLINWVCSRPIRAPLSQVNGDESPGSPIGHLYTRNPHVYPSPHGE